MSLPFLLRKLFENDGAGEKLNPAIIPTDTALSDTSTNPIANSVVKAAIDAKSFPVDSALSTTSTNAVQNRVINSALASKVNTSALATVATSGSYNDLLNKPTISSGITVVAESYTSSGWYRKYSDGWIEQGIPFSMSLTGVSSTKTINFLLSMNTVYGWSGPFPIYTRTFKYTSSSSDTKETGEDKVTVTVTTSSLTIKKTYSGPYSTAQASYYLSNWPLYSQGTLLVFGK